MKKENKGRRLARENRRIKWSDSKTANRSFLSALAIVLIFTAIIGLFSWGIAALFSSLD